MKKKIIICSAYNRAIWLATELQSKGHEITYLDFSSRLGGLSPEAWDPPFGIFHTKKMSYSQNISLNEGATLKKVETGFTVLAEKGPMEFQGPLFKKGFERYGIDQDQLDYIRASVSMSDESFLKFKYHFKKEKFEKIWFLHLLHQLASNIYYPNITAIDNKNRPLPVLENWSLRSSSRRDSKDVLNTTAAKGVQVLQVAGIQNIQYQNQILNSLSITDEKGNAHNLDCNLLISFLSQEEFSTVHAQTFSHMVDATPIMADWFWTRYRFFTNQNDVTEVLPDAFLMIDDRFLPWTHQNLLFVHRGLRSHEFVIWCRIPSHYRLQQNLLESAGRDIQTVFKNHFPGVEVQQVELPLECLATEFQVHAPHLPVFSHAKVAKKKSSDSALNYRKTKFKNVMWCGPEAWKRLDTAYLFEYQQEIFDTVMGANDQQGISRRRGRDQEIYS